MEEVLVFPSTYYMLRSEELLRRKGYALRLVPAPPQAGELCVTAIAISPGNREEIVGYLQGENILIKAVLPYKNRLARPLAAALEGIIGRYKMPPALRDIFEAIKEGNQLGAAEVAELLSLAMSDGSEAVSEAADAVTRAYFGGRVTALVGVRIAGRGTRGLIDLPGIKAIVEEMSRLGFVYILLDIGEMEKVPWPPRDLRKALGERTIAVIAAASLVQEAGAMVRDHGIRQFLRYGNDISDLNDRGLADEIVFLRDNLPGPVGSGNLLPLLDPGPEMGGVDVVVGGPLCESFSPAGSETGKVGDPGDPPAVYVIGAARRLGAEYALIENIPGMLAEKGLREEKFQLNGLSGFTAGAHRQGPIRPTPINGHTVLHARAQERWAFGPFSRRSATMKASSTSTLSR